MASWEDGPEYAPIERPDDFFVPPQAPLVDVAPYQQPAALAPKDRPQFAKPPVSGVPLAQLLPVMAAPRDPGIPFDVVSSAVTSTDSGWGAVHWSPPTGPPVGLPPNGQWGPPTGAPWPAPETPFAPPSGPAPSVSGYPAPGTPGWFAPPPYGLPPIPAGPVGARQVLQAITPGIVICLLLGGLIYVIAPITLVVGAALSSRVQVARQAVQRTFWVGLGALGVIGALVALNDPLDFSDWWDGTAWAALVICWALLVAVPIVVVRALRTGARPGPRGTTWG